MEAARQEHEEEGRKKKNKEDQHDHLDATISTSVDSKDANELIYFSSLHELYGALRLARRYVTKERLEYLFQTVGGVIVLDENADVSS